jgi:hypothetical protein
MARSKRPRKKKASPDMALGVLIYEDKNGRPDSKVVAGDESDMRDLTSLLRLLAQAQAGIIAQMVLAVVDGAEQHEQ